MFVAHSLDIIMYYIHILPKIIIIKTHLASIIEPPSVIKSKQTIRSYQLPNWIIIWAIKGYIIIEFCVKPSHWWLNTYLTFTF
jgi:hypothetical protein